MTKKLLKLIGSFVDQGNPKLELNNALVDFDDNIIVATDTRMIIRVPLHEGEVEDCRGKYLLNKKVLKAAEGIADKDGQYSFEDNALILGYNHLSVDTVKEEFSYPDHAKIFQVDWDDSFKVDSIEQIDFELTHLDTHINGADMNAAVEYATASYYHIYYKAQLKEDPGMVMIKAFDSANTLLYQALYMGVQFIPKRPTLFDHSSAA